MLLWSIGGRSGRLSSIRMRTILLQTSRSPPPIWIASSSKVTASLLAKACENPTRLGSSQNADTRPKRTAHDCLNLALSMARTRCSLTMKYALGGCCAILVATSAHNRLGLQLQHSARPIRLVLQIAAFGNRRKDNLRWVNYKSEHLIFDVHLWQRLADERRAAQDSA